MSTKVLLIFLFFSYFLIQNFLFFLFCQSQVSYFPIFLSNYAAGHPVRLFAAPNLLGDAERVLFWCEG